MRVENPRLHYLNGDAGPFHAAYGVDKISSVKGNVGCQSGIMSVSQRCARDVRTWGQQCADKTRRESRDAYDSERTSSIEGSSALVHAPSSRLLAVT